MESIAQDRLGQVTHTMKEDLKITTLFFLSNNEKSYKIKGTILG